MGCHDKCYKKCESCHEQKARCLHHKQKKSHCKNVPCNAAECLSGCGTGFLTEYANFALDFAPPNNLPGNVITTDITAPGATVKNKATNNWNIGLENGEVCFGIEFLENLDTINIGAGVGSTAFTTGLGIPNASSAPRTACGDIEVCSGWYQYNVSGSASALLAKAKTLAIIDAVAILNGEVTSTTTDLALQVVQSLYENNIGWYKASYFKGSQSLQIWFSHLPVVQNTQQQLLDLIDGNVKLFDYNSGFANLVLDGHYKACKGYGGRRYSGALNSSQLNLLAAKKDNADPVFPDIGTLTPGDDLLFPKTIYARTQRYYGTLSINVVIPSA